MTHTSSDGCFPQAYPTSGPYAKSFSEFGRFRKDPVQESMMSSIRGKAEKRERELHPCVFNGIAGGSGS